MDQRKLAALPYHESVAAYLKAQEPAVWRWSQSAAVQADQVEEMRAVMLRDTYRMEAESHPDVHRICRAAMDVLGIEAPVTIYQAQDGAMNAALWFVPGEIHLVMHGPILDRLAEEELAALFGHELAHYRLWTEGEGEHHNASRILNHALSYPNIAPSHRETARLLGLATELYADRGAAMAAGAVNPVISMLVRTMTGAGSVDPAAYLRQAEEAEKSVARSEGASHPELFLRARALSKWWEEGAAAEAWIDERLRGAMSVESLDLLRQKQLTEATGAFLAWFVRGLPTQSAPVQAQARRYFPDLDQLQPGFDPADYAAERADDSVRQYLVALMLDCAFADPELRDEVLAQAAPVVRRIGAEEQFAQALRRDLQWSKAAVTRLLAGKAAA